MPRVARTSIVESWAKVIDSWENFTGRSAPLDDLLLGESCHRRMGYHLVTPAKRKEDRSRDLAEPYSVTKQIIPKRGLNVLGPLFFGQVVGLVKRSFCRFPE